MKELAQALLEVQRAMPAIEPNATNPHFKSKYVSLDHLLAVTLPILHRHGVVLVQNPTNIEGAPALKTTFIHAESGDIQFDVMPLVLDKENSQGLGSALTYCRRYMLAAALGISSEKDDDGNAASPQEPKAKRETAKSKRAKLEARLEELAAEADAKRDVAAGVSLGEVFARLGDTPDEQKLIDVGLDLSDWLMEGCPCPFHEYQAVRF
jgi:hypothetical protein